MQQKILRMLGAFGAALYIAIFIRTPSFPTPDKIFVLLVLGGMAYGQAWKVIKRFGPFVVLLLVYESFRGFAPYLNKHVNYTPMIKADRLLGLGTLPTTRLQSLLWHGTVQWYDFVFYGAYTLHFVLPFALALLIWKTREKEYWRYIVSLVILSFMGFLTYLIFPAAPPWMASEVHLIEPIARVSSAVWYAFGIHDFPSVYNKISPNPVAAVPSLHAAYAFLIAWVTTRLYKTKWRYIIWVYPLLIWIGTIYMGEHYLIDAVLGVIYAVGAYKASPVITSFLQKQYKRVIIKLR